MTESSKRRRRTTEQMIADLQARIETIKARAAQRQAKRSPALRHMNAALRSIDKAMTESEDSATRKALDEARATLAACLALNGQPTGSRKSAEDAPRGRRSQDDVEAISGRLLDHLRANPGQRGEEIADALDTDTTTIRLPMRKLIAAKQVRTTGEKRGMRYYAR